MFMWKGSLKVTHPQIIITQLCCSPQLNYYFMEDQGLWTFAVYYLPEYSRDYMKK